MMIQLQAQLTATKQIYDVSKFPSFRRTSHNSDVVNLDPRHMPVQQQPPRSNSTLGGLAGRLRVEGSG